jgi:hypothetical protein
MQKQRKTLSNQKTHNQFRMSEFVIFSIVISAVILNVLSRVQMTFANFTFYQSCILVEPVEVGPGVVVDLTGNLNRGLSCLPSAPFFLLLLLLAGWPFLAEILMTTLWLPCADGSISIGFALGFGLDVGFLVIFFLGFRVSAGLTVFSTSFEPPTACFVVGGVVVVAAASATVVDVATASVAAAAGGGVVAATGAGSSSTASSSTTSSSCAIAPAQINTSKHVSSVCAQNQDIICSVFG